MEDVERLQAVRVLDELLDACEDGRLDASPVMLGGLVGARTALSDP